MGKLKKYYINSNYILVCPENLRFPRIYPAGIYLLKVNNRNTRTRFEICSKLTIKTPERRHWVGNPFLVNFSIS